MGQPYYPTVFEALLLLLVYRVEVELQLGALIEPQQQLVVLYQDCALPGGGVLSPQKNLLIKLDLGGYLGLILIARGKLKRMFLTAKHNLIPGISFLLLIDGQPQIFP